MIRHGLRRSMATATAAGLIALGTLSGPASAADNRLIFIGSPGTEGVLDPTTTVPGGLTAIDVTVGNTGGQTINSIRLLGGDAADAAPVNPLFPAPPPPSLPAGAKYVASFPSCGIPEGGATTLTCDIGTIRKRSSVTYRIIIQTPAAAGSYSTWLGAYVAEGNATGSNQDNFYAVGTITSSAASCSPSSNSSSNYFLPAALIDLDSAACGNSGQHIDAGIKSGQALAANGQGAFAQIVVEDSATATCPGAVKGCFGNTVFVQALDGLAVPGGLEWTVTWYGTRSLAGVIHYLDGGGFDLIPFTKKFQCGTKLTSNCWVTTSASSGSADPLWFSATFITTGNGKSQGFV